MCFQFLYASTLYAQGDRISFDGAVIDPAIKVQAKEEILSTIQTAIERFTDWAVFPQAAQGSINDDISNYVSLFEPTAKVYEDYREGTGGKLVELNNYVIEIKTFLEKVGLPGLVYNPKMLSMQYDALDKNVILTRVTLFRKYTHYLDENNQVKVYSNPSIRELEIVFATPVYYTQESLIRSFQPSNVPMHSTPETKKSDVQKTLIIDEVEISANSLILVPGVVNTKWNSIGMSEQVKIKEIIAGELGKYQYYGHLLEDGNKEVTADAINKFRQLFNSDNSLHIPDFDQYQENQLAVSEYGSRAFQELRYQGVEFELINPQIESVRLDPAGYYSIRVTAVKRMKSYVDFKTKKPVMWKTPKDIPIAFDYELGQTYNYVYLMEVKPKSAQKVREDSRSTLALLTSFGTLNPSATPNADWLAVTDNVEIPSVSKIGVGLEYSTNSLAADRSTNKPLFIALGLNYSFFTLSSSGIDLTNSKAETTADSISGLYGYDIQTIEDDIAINQLEIPIGVDYRIFKPAKGRIQGFIGARILPTYVLSAKHTYSASPFYNLTYEQHGFDFYDNEHILNLNPESESWINQQYGIGNQELTEQKGNPIDSKFLLGYEVNAHAQITLSSEFILMAGVKYQGYTSSFIEHNSSNAEFPFLDRPDSNDLYARNSLLQDFYDKMTSSAINVFVGIALKLH